MKSVTRLGSCEWIDFCSFATISLAINTSRRGTMIKFKVDENNIVLAQVVAEVIEAYANNGVAEREVFRQIAP